VAFVVAPPIVTDDDDDGDGMAGIAIDGGKSVELIDAGVEDQLGRCDEDAEDELRSDIEISVDGESKADAIVFRPPLTAPRRFCSVEPAEEVGSPTDRGGFRLLDVLPSLSLLLSYEIDRKYILELVSRLCKATFVTKRDTMTFSGLLVWLRHISLPS
jgi:hypothetical protein